MAVLLHDVKRTRLSNIAPQAAPSRLPPEIHAIAAVLAGLGAALLWTWWIGLVVLVVHAGLSWTVAPRLVEIVAHRLPPLHL